MAAFCKEGAGEKATVLAAATSGTSAATTVAEKTVTVAAAVAVTMATVMQDN